MKISQPSPEDKGPEAVSQYSVVNAAFIEALNNNTVFITCTAGLKRYQLEHKYDPAYVVNTAYLWACDEIDQGKEIKNFPGWIRLTCTRVILQLSQAASAPQPAHWLDVQEDTFEPQQVNTVVAQHL